MTTQADLARLDGFHPVRFNAIVKGRVHPAKKTGKRLVKRYGGSMEIWTEERFAPTREKLVKSYLEKIN